MPQPPEALAAYQRKVSSILSSVDHLGAGYVKNAMSMLEQLRREVERRMLAVPPDSFTWRHLSGVKTAINRAIQDLVVRYGNDMAGLLGQAQRLGVDVVDSMGTLAPGITLGPVVTRNMVEVAARYSADLISNVGAQAIRRVNGILGQVVLGVISPYEAIAQIAGRLPHPSVFGTLGARAEAIYRTESNRMFSMATQSRLNQMSDRLRGLKKMWLSAGDSRVRPSHRLAHGQTVEARSRFIVGGYSAAYPRDPALPASESVNCRCHVVPIVDEDVLSALLF